MAVMQESAAFIPLPKFFETSFGEISKLSSNHLRDNSAFFLKISVFECCKMIVIISKESIKGKIEVKMILKQGKKNEIRRIFKFLDLNLISLERIRIGEIRLSNLALGTWRPLTKKELNFLTKIQS